jgi:DNA-binding NarL/FixJ family response regulator
MTGGTLVMSKAVNLHSHFKKRFEELGFSGITITSLEKDALRMLINEIKPKLIIVGARYYQCSTPYMMGELKKVFPKINMAAVSICEYPAELAMYFIINGIKSYVTAWEGLDQFYKGLGDIAKGKEYISPDVQKRLDMRKDYPKPASTITNRQKEVLRLTCNGLREVEIADMMHISRRTVDTHKKELFTSLNVRSSFDLIRVALSTKIIPEEEIYFYPKHFILKPVPDRTNIVGDRN